jgi:hypothetical protein
MAPKGQFDGKSDPEQNAGLHPHCLTETLIYPRLDRVLFLESFGTKQIKTSAVATAKIKNAAVTTSKLPDNAVTSGKIADGEVRAGDLGTIVTAQNTLQIAAGAEGTVDVVCPEGSVILSGGGYWTTGLNNLRTTLKRGNGWRVEGKNTLGVPAPLTVQAYCLTG